AQRISFHAQIFVFHAQRNSFHAQMNSFHTQTIAFHAQISFFMLKSRLSRSNSVFQTGRWGGEMKNEMPIHTTYLNILSIWSFALILALLPASRESLAESRWIPTCDRPAHGNRRK